MVIVALYYVVQVRVGRRHLCSRLKRQHEHDVCYELKRVYCNVYMDGRICDYFILFSIMVFKVVRRPKECPKTF